MNKTLAGILEPLDAYARPASADTPPELLPWESDVTWAMDGAARRVLGLIVAGEEPGHVALRCRRLPAWRSTRPATGLSQFPDAVLLNGTALALCGYLCEGRHPEAHIWRITGCARLATEMHARKAALENRIAADCLLAVCRVADELGLPILADLITLRERMWGRLLDHARAEMLHVPEALYPAHMTQPVPPESSAR